jgi:hypothetical protein
MPAFPSALLAASAGGDVKARAEMAALIHFAVFMMRLSFCQTQAKRPGLRLRSSFARLPHPVDQ